MAGMAPVAAKLAKNSNNLRTVDRIGDVRHGIGRGDGISLDLARTSPPRPWTTTAAVPPEATPARTEDGLQSPVKRVR